MIKRAGVKTLALFFFPLYLHSNGRSQKIKGLSLLFSPHLLSHFRNEERKEMGKWAFSFPPLFLFGEMEEIEKVKGRGFPLFFCSLFFLKGREERNERGFSSFVSFWREKEKEGGGRVIDFYFFLFGKRMRKIFKIKEKINFCSIRNHFLSFLSFILKLQAKKEKTFNFSYVKIIFSFSFLSYLLCPHVRRKNI